MGAYAPGFTVGTQRQQLEVGQQRVGFDQKGACRIIAVVLEGWQISGHAQIRGLQDQITADLAHAGGTQVAQHQPQALHGQLGIAAAAEDQVALKLAIADGAGTVEIGLPLVIGAEQLKDRKSTRLNSSHVRISYAVFCLKKKKKTEKE